MDEIKAKELVDELVGPMHEIGIKVGPEPLSSPEDIAEAEEMAHALGIMPGIASRIFNKEKFAKMKIGIKAAEKYADELSDRIKAKYDKDKPSGPDLSKLMLEELEKSDDRGAVVLKKVMANHQAKVVELLGDKSSGKTDLYENLADVVKRYQEGSLQFNVTGDKKKELTDAKNLATSPETFKKFLKDYVIKSLGMDETAGADILKALDIKEVRDLFNAAVTAEATSQLVGNVRHETLEDTKLNSVMPEERKASTSYVNLVQLKAMTTAESQLGKIEKGLTKEIHAVIKGAAPKQKDIIDLSEVDAASTKQGVLDALGRIIENANKQGVFFNHFISPLQAAKKQIEMGNDDEIVVKASKGVIKTVVDEASTEYVLDKEGLARDDVGKGIKNGVRDTAHFLTGGITKGRVYEAEKSSESEKAGQDLATVYNTLGAAKGTNKTMKGAGQPQLDEKKLEATEKDATKLSKGQEKEYDAARSGGNYGRGYPFRSKKIRRTYNLIHGLLDVWKNQNFGIAAGRTAAFEALKTMGDMKAAADLRGEKKSDVRIGFEYREKLEEDLKTEKGDDYMPPEEREAQAKKDAKRAEELKGAKTPEEREALQEKWGEEDGGEIVKAMRDADESNALKASHQEHAEILNLSSIFEKAYIDARVNQGTDLSSQDKEDLKEDLKAIKSTEEMSGEMIKNISGDNYYPEAVDKTFEILGEDMSVASCVERMISIVRDSIVMESEMLEDGRVVKKPKVTKSSAGAHFPHYNELGERLIENLPGGKELRGDYMHAIRVIVEQIVEEKNNNAGELLRSDKRYCGVRQLLLKTIEKGKQIDKEQGKEMEEEKKKEAE